MQLVGQTIQHKSFGKGIVTDWAENILTISFSAGEKKFIYPDAFSNYLTLKNSTMQKNIQSILKRQADVKEAQRQALQKEQTRNYLLRNFKIPPNSQAAFDIKPEQCGDLFSTWSVSTGTYVSGYSKGEVRIPDRLNPNSLCLLTRRENQAPESERRILGAFMVEEDFLGCDCRDGKISAHPIYRLNLPEEQRPFFWPYLSQEPSQQRWGRVAFKYLPNETAEKILFDLKEALASTGDAGLAEQFYQYHRKLNHLRIR